MAKNNNNSSENDNFTQAELEAMNPVQPKGKKNSKSILDEVASKIPNADEIETATVSIRVRRKTLLSLKSLAQKKGCTLSSLGGSVLDAAVTGH